MYFVNYSFNPIQKEKYTQVVVRSLALLSARVNIYISCVYVYVCVCVCILNNNILKIHRPAGFFHIFFFSSFGFAATAPQCRVVIRVGKTGLIAQLRIDLGAKEEIAAKVEDLMCTFQLEIWNEIAAI